MFTLAVCHEWGIKLSESLGSQVQKFWHRAMCNISDHQCTFCPLILMCSVRILRVTQTGWVSIVMQQEMESRKRKLSSVGLWEIALGYVPVSLCLTTAWFDTCVCTQTHMHTCSCMHLRFHIHACMCAPTHTHTHTHTHMCMSTHTVAHTVTQTQTHREIRLNTLICNYFWHILIFCTVLNN